MITLLIVAAGAFLAGSLVTILGLRWLLKRAADQAIQQIWR